MSDGKESSPGLANAPVVERLVRVDAVEGESAWVLADRMGGCGGCSEKGGCGHAALMGEAPPMRLKIANRLNAAPDEWVVLGVTSGSLLGSLMLAYGLPLGGFLGGALLGASIAPVAAMLGGAVGLGLMLLVCRRIFRARGAAGDVTAEPRMLRFAPPPVRDGCTKT